MSPSNLGRIENGQRFPSARTLRKIAGPLAFGELELFACAHYLSPESANVVDDEAPTGNLDPHVAIVLSARARRTATHDR